MAGNAETSLTLDTQSGDAVELEGASVLEINGRKCLVGVFINNREDGSLSWFNIDL